MKYVFVCFAADGFVETCGIDDSSVSMADCAQDIARKIQDACLFGVTKIRIIEAEPRVSMDAFVQFKDYSFTYQHKGR